MLPGMGSLQGALERKYLGLVEKEVTIKAFVIGSARCLIMWPSSEEGGADLHSGAISREGQHHQPLLTCAR